MLKSRLLTYLVVIAMALCFTSCINIIEKLKLNKNGSGTYAMTIDMGRLAGMMKMMGQDGEGMDELMHSADSTFQANRAKLENLEGISNVQFLANRHNLNFIISYDFENLDALNQAIWAYNSQRKDTEYVDFFRFDKKVFSRANQDILTEALTGTMAEDGELEIDPALIFGDMSYQLEIEFARKIKKVSNEDYEQLDKNTLTWKKYVFDKRDEDKTIGVEVRLR